MTTEYDHIAHDFAEGRGREKLRNRAETEHGSRADLPTLYRYVVLETIFDPHIIDATKIEYWENDLGVSNIKHAIVAPRNAIIARRVANNNSTHSGTVMVLYPFMPPNLAMPCKPGEHVWVVFEDQMGTKNDLGYWMWRIVGPQHAEDVNHTHPHRANDPSFSPGIKEQFDGDVQPVYEIRNGDTGIENGERYTKAETASIPDGNEDAYKELMNDSDGGRLSVYERVPRFRKRPGDMVLEGTNNTLIVLGRDRTAAVASYENDPVQGQVPTTPPEDSSDLEGQGSIDIVVGRGETETTGGITVENDLPGKEIAKGNDERVPDEGDPDYANDRSRILISQRTFVDTNFGIDGFNAEFGGGKFPGTPDNDDVPKTVSDSSEGDGAIVIKSDKVRLIARSDIEFLVTGFTLDESGRMTTDDDQSRWCAIVMKTNGDIVMKPADQGYIKLGGEDADKGLVITDTPAPAENGRVARIATPPILTTMGGQFATGNPGQGMLATKILVKGDIA